MYQVTGIVGQLVLRKERNNTEVEDIEGGGGRRTADVVNITLFVAEIA